MCAHASRGKTEAVVLLLPEIYQIKRVEGERQGCLIDERVGLVEKRK